MSQLKPPPPVVLLLAITFGMAIVAITGIAFLLVGYGEHRSAAHCAQITATTLNQEFP